MTMKKTLLSILVLAASVGAANANSSTPIKLAVNMSAKTNLVQWFNNLPANVKALPGYQSGHPIDLKVNLVDDEYKLKAPIALPKSNKISASSTLHSLTIASDRRNTVISSSTGSIFLVDSSSYKTVFSHILLVSENPKASSLIVNNGANFSGEGVFLSGLKADGGTTLVTLTDSYVILDNPVFINNASAFFNNDSFSYAPMYISNAATVFITKGIMNCKTTSSYTPKFNIKDGSTVVMISGAKMEGFNKNKDLFSVTGGPFVVVSSSPSLNVTKLNFAYKKDKSSLLSVNGKKLPTNTFMRPLHGLNSE